MEEANAKRPPRLHANPDVNRDLEAAIKLKDEGNECFNDRRFCDATAKYDEACAKLLPCKIGTEEAKLVSICCSNISACSLSEGQYGDAETLKKKFAKLFFGYLPRCEENSCI